MTRRATWITMTLLAAGLIGLAGCGGEKTATGDGSSMVASSEPTAMGLRLAGRWTIDPAATASIMRTVDGGTFRVENDADETRLRTALSGREGELPVYEFRTDGTGTVSSGTSMRMIHWTAAQNVVHIQMAAGEGAGTTVATATLEDGERLVVAVPMVGTFVYRNGAATADAS